MAARLEELMHRQKPLVSSYTTTLLKRAESQHGSDSWQFQSISRQYFELPHSAGGRAASRRHYEAEMGRSAPLGIERLYRRAVVVDLLTACASECVFCIRGLYDNRSLKPDDFGPVVDYIASHAEIQEVLVTGGDPFVAPARLGQFLRRLDASCPAVTTVRIGTRMPVQDPRRCEAVAAMLSDLRTRLRLEVGLQVNSPFELQDEARAALGAIQEAGAAIYSQNVLLKGVNDSANILIDLYDALRGLGVEPHYLFHAVPMVGTDHLRTSIRRSLRIIADVSASGYLSGRAKPRFALMTAVGKVTPYHGVLEGLDSRSGEITVHTSFRLADRKTWNPGYVLPTSASVGVDGLISVRYLDGQEEAIA